MASLAIHINSTVRTGITDECRFKLRSCRAAPLVTSKCCFDRSKAQSVIAGSTRMNRGRQTIHVRAAVDKSKENGPPGPPPGCTRYTVALGRPLGLVLEENSNKEIYVAEILPESSGAKCGLIAVGDTLISTSAIVNTTAQTYGEVEVKGGEKRITLNCYGESFETVMAAIGTHKSAMEVQLEFQVCDTNKEMWR
mmetsp:Transcript_4443/g.8358  ORF Transcript_4443/g.8358 Transcript_4443/m.8358 type:complete len:195 (-) Transcript_4443:180-764(-)